MRTLTLAVGQAALSTVDIARRVNAKTRLSFTIQSRRLRNWIRDSLRRKPKPRRPSYKRFLEESQTLLLAGYHFPAGMTSQIALQRCLRTTMMRCKVKLPPGRSVFHMMGWAQQAGLLDAELRSRMDIVVQQLQKVAQARGIKPKTVAWLVNEVRWICHALEKIDATERRVEA